MFRRVVMAMVFILSLVVFAAAGEKSPKSRGGDPMPEENVELSESGSPIYRHKEKERGYQAPQHFSLHLEELEAHVEKHIGKIETVFHEVVSDLIHLDVLFIPATPERPYHVLVTSGMSDEPMKVPDGMEKYNRAELILALPKEWPLTQESFKDESNYWPIRWLKQIGRLPHEYDTWIGWGHTIPNGDPAEAIANTSFTGVMVTLPYSLPEEFFQLKTKSGEVITFYALIPLYQEEMDLKLRKGAEELEERFEKQRIGFVIDTKRPNVATKKGWFR